MALSVTVHGFMTLPGSQTAGRWATADILTDDGSDTLVYTVPSNVEYMMLAISITNRDVNSADNVSVAISQDTPPNDFDFIEHRVALIPSGTFERTQLVLNANDKIYVRWGIPTP